MPNSKIALKAKGGFNLIEVCLSLAIFSTAAALIFLLLNDGFKKWRILNARSDSQRRLNRALQWLKRDLERADPGQVDHQRIASSPGQGDMLWFLSAEDPSVSASDQRFSRDTSNGTPRWKRQVLYYLIRPGNYAAVSQGYNCAIDPDPRNDYYAPHKFLIRKVIDTALDPERLMSPAAIVPFITAPADYNLSPLSAEPLVENCRLIADRMLSFEVSRFDRTLEIDLRVVDINSVDKVAGIGSVSLKNSRFTQHQKIRLVMRQ
jgi:type II secretory pathway pseudopilin PulG